MRRNFGAEDIEECGKRGRRIRRLQCAGSPVIDFRRLELVQQFSRNGVERHHRRAAVSRSEHPDGMRKRSLDDGVIARPVLAQRRQIRRRFAETALREPRAQALRQRGAGGREAPGDGDCRGHQALGGPVISLKLCRAGGVKEKGGFPSQIARAVRASHVRLLGRSVFLIAEVAAPDGEDQLVPLLRNSRQRCRQHRHGTIEVPMIAQRLPHHDQLLGVHALQNFAPIEGTAHPIGRIVQSAGAQQREPLLQRGIRLAAHEDVHDVRVEVAPPRGRRGGVEPTGKGHERPRIAPGSEILGLVVDGLIAIDRPCVLEDERLTKPAGRRALVPRVVDFRLMEKGQIAKQISGRQKRGDLLHRLARFVVLDHGPCMQVGKLVAPVQIGMRFLDPLQQLVEGRPTSADLQLAELIRPLADRSHLRGGRRGRLLSGRGVEDAMPPQALPRQHDRKDADQDKKNGERDQGDASSQASSRARVPDTMAWGARLRISFRAIG